MKTLLIICSFVVLAFGFLAWHDNNLSAYIIGMHTLSAADEAVIIAGEEGYYCATGTGGCTASGASAGINDTYPCTKATGGNECNSTWCEGRTNGECKQATWGFQWANNCTLRSQGCPQMVAVCVEMRGGLYGCMGQKTKSFSGCGNYDSCD